MTKYQNYSHYKLPISMDPLKYGKLLEQIGNKYIIQLNTTNVVIIIQKDSENYIKFFRKGEFMFEFKDVKKSDISFVRTIADQRYTFEKNKLISTEILSTVSSIFIYPLYEDTNALLNKNTVITPFKFNIDSIFDWIDNSKDPLKAFLIWELCLILILYIIFIILPDQFLNNNLTLASMSAGNIIKLRKVKPKHIWKDVAFKINNKIFSKILFVNLFSKFWNEIENEFSNSNHMFILLKIKYNNGEFSSVGKVQRINKSDYSWYIDFIIENMKFKSEYYNETQIESIVFSYGFKTSKIKDKGTFAPNNITFQNYKNYNLPISMNHLDYGRLIAKNNLEKWLAYTLQNEKDQTITFNKFDKFNEVEFFKSGISLVKFKDILINENKFMRIIDNKKFYFENGEQILFTKEMKTKFIEKTQKSKDMVNNILTLDIETYIDGKTLIPFLICFYDGKKSYSFGLWDYISVEQMMLACFQSIFIRKYNGYKIYVHNLAKFDVIFLFKYLVKIAIIDPKIHKGRIISLGINYGENNEYQIEFRDSYLILLSSLRKLCTAFKVETVKSIFPFLFVNKDNLNYIGNVPDIKHFMDISKNDYREYKSKFKNNWNLKEEAIKYCNLDCISLYQVLFKFNDMIFSLFSVNIHRFPTLPSLAFGIFRTKFMKEENIPQLSGKITNDIRQGYTGGSCEVYIPQSKPGIKIKCYDVNSLYPSQMESRLMPVGKPNFFKGDITLIDENAFGFFYCKINAPDDIKHPILQTHVKTPGGIRTIAPIGTWEDMLFSAEMKNAIKNGYQIEILWGYTFNNENIFEDYVSFLYNLRLEYTKSHPMNYIAKILLNSLYGRFGMDDNFMNINVIHKDYYPDFENKYLDFIEDKIELENHYIVFYNSIKANDESDVSTHNVSIGIAAAITAYARIHMSQFKNNLKINLYYSDTDSIYTDSDIESYLIDNKMLGKLKLENVCNKAIFLAPKVYCLETEDGKIIYKVKGLKHEIKLNLSDYKHLLKKDALIKKNQEKWFRKLSDGKIDILNEVYTLQVTDNKRKLIYDKNNNFIGTKNYRITNEKSID